MPPPSKPLVTTTVELADGSVETIVFNCLTLESIERISGRSIAAINDEMARYHTDAASIRVGTMYAVVAGALRAKRPTITDDELADLVTPGVLMPAVQSMAPAWNAAVLQLLNLDDEGKDPKAPSAVGEPGASLTADSSPANSTGSTPPTSG